jgi:hypothetical protein
MILRRCGVWERVYLQVVNYDTPYAWSLVTYIKWITTLSSSGESGFLHKPCSWLPGETGC